MLLRTSIAADANCMPHFMRPVIFPFVTALIAHLQSLPTFTFSRISFRSGSVMPAFFANFWSILKNFWACSIIFRPAIMLLFSRRPRTELPSGPSSGLLKSSSTFHLWTVCTRLMRSASRARTGPSPPSSSSSSSRSSAGVSSSRSRRRAPARGAKCSWSSAAKVDEGSWEAARPACTTSPTSRPSACSRGSLRPRRSSKMARCCRASSWMASSCAGTPGCRRSWTPSSWTRGSSGPSWTTCGASATRGCRRWGATSGSWCMQALRPPRSPRPPWPRCSRSTSRRAPGPCGGCATSSPLPSCARTRTRRTAARGRSSPWTPSA
mmetsp:Transcript_62409/g.188352  ORF Transcript_62409/g.188352 Transcript_62409/m.188352 type:complete len:323 (-) Transcript_62409:665-1633(-)